MISEHRRAPFYALIQLNGKKLIWAIKWSFLSFVDAHGPEGRLRNRWGTYRGRTERGKPRLQSGEGARIPHLSRHLIVPASQKPLQPD